jgi:hypothetical protein
MLTVRVLKRTAQPSTRILPSGLPLAGAQVTVLRGAQRIASGATNANGVYTIPLPPGAYSVKVEARGFAPAGKTAALTERGATVDFQLMAIDGGGQSLIGPDRRTPLPLGLKKVPTEGLKERIPSAKRLVEYVIEYRFTLDSTPWQEYGRYPTQREANRALFFAVEHNLIPRGAETRIVVRRSS